MLDVTYGDLTSVRTFDVYMFRSISLEKNSNRYRWSSRQEIWSDMPYSGACALSMIKIFSDLHIQNLQ